MIGYIEWVSAERKETERANVTRCVGAQGFYRIEFSNHEVTSEGRLAFSVQDGDQSVMGMYSNTYAEYKGEAEVVGKLVTSGDIVTFSGTWHDPEDATGQWDVYVEFEKPSDHTYTFTYDEHDMPK